MATIYRFIVEQKVSKSGDGRNNASQKIKGAAKTKTLLSMLTDTGKGGVEHNRKLRAINPLLNKMTGGAWEKGMRLGRAGLGLLKFDAKTGAFAGISGVAVAIIFSFILQTTLKILEKDQEKARHQNEHNYKQMENGIGAVHGQYKLSTNVLTGRHTYNQNK